MDSEQFVKVDELNTCYPAKIISYDPKTQTCRVQVQVEEYYSGLNYSYKKQEAPILADVPVHVCQGGGFSLTFPINEGDDCLVLYAQKGYDHWLYSGASETGLINGIPPAEHKREFSLRDAICIVGLRPLVRPISDYNPSDVELRNVDGTQKISLKESGDIVVVSSSKVSVEAPDVDVVATNIKLVGNVQVEGNFSCSGSGTFVGDVSMDGVSGANHKHTGNQGQPTSPPLKGGY